MLLSRHSPPMLFAVIACLASANPAGAVVRYVDSRATPGGDGLSWATACDSLSTALAAAQPGDQIWVATGRYVGNFGLVPGVELCGGFSGTETELAQRGWTANATVLDGNRTGSVVTSPPEATATTRIDGFTITNGTGTALGSYRYGGGLYLANSSPTIANNTITGSTAYYGGGLYLNSSFATIANNTIADNTAEYGGGLRLSSSSPTILKNTITNNRASFGGGLKLAYSSPTIVNNTITANSASYEGGGLYLSSSFPTIANNTIMGNGAAHGGGGIYLNSSSPTIANNRITGNGAHMGAGLYSRGSSPIIVNNTITDNSTDDGGGMYLVYSNPTIANTIVAFNSTGIAEVSSTPTLRYNCVYGNNRYDYFGLTDPTGTDGNISANPFFVRNPDDGGDGWGDDPGTPYVDEGANDDFGDLRLLSGSPCVDAGDNATVPADTPDLDGDGNRTEPLPFDLSGWSRFVDNWLAADTGLGTPPIVDMGAYEHPAPGDCNGSGLLDLTDFATSVDCLAGPGSAVPVECDCAPMDSDGDFDLADFADFQERFSNP